MANTDRVTRRLYSLYPEQVEKLKKLADLAGIPQSMYLRQLIDVAYVEKVHQKGSSTYHYGAEN